MRERRRWALLALGALLLTACTKPDQPAAVTACRIKPTNDIACPMQYDPVCGCDGKTYPSGCMARAAGITRTTPGACETKDPNE